MDFKDRVVLVTGASSGIGMETAGAFLEKGARVYLNGRDKEKLVSTVDKFNQLKGNAIALPGDVSKVGQCEAMLQEVEAAGRGGPLVWRCGKETSSFPA